MTEVWKRLDVEKVLLDHKTWLVLVKDVPKPFLRLRYVVITNQSQLRVSACYHHYCCGITTMLITDCHFSGKNDTFKSEYLLFFSHLLWYILVLNSWLNKMFYLKISPWALGNSSSNKNLLLWANWIKIVTLLPCVIFGHLKLQGMYNTVEF